MNLPKEYIDIYREYLKTINEITKDVRAIRRKQKFISKTEEIKNGQLRLIDQSSKSKIYTFENGDTYIGKLVEGKMDGRGTYFFVDDNDRTVEYTGEFKEDMKHGKGMYTLANGNVYIGNFENDLISGIGQMCYTSQNEYIGNWEKGLKNGHGIYRWSEGTTYIGEFRKSNMDGKGVCLDKDGNIIYDGEWKNNLVHGHGTYYWEEGKWYVGEFVQGKKHGFGTFYIDNELAYEGTWKFDKPCIFNRSLDEIFSIKL